MQFGFPNRQQGRAFRIVYNLRFNTTGSHLRHSQNRSELFEITGSIPVDSGGSTRENYVLLYNRRLFQ